LPTYQTARPLNLTSAPHLPQLLLVSGMTHRQPTAKILRPRLPRSTEYRMRRRRAYRPTRGAQPWFPVQCGEFTRRGVAPQPDLPPRAPAFQWWALFSAGFIPGLPYCRS